MSHEADDYRPKQAARDAEYRREYAAWLATLTPAERARVKAAGLAEPVRDEHGYGSNFSERDLAETSLAATDSHPLDSIEPACDQPGFQAQRTDAEEVWDVVRRLLGELLVQNAPRGSAHQQTRSANRIAAGAAITRSSRSNAWRSRPACRSSATR